MNVDDYINFPEKNVTDELLTDQEIVDLLKPEEAEESDEEDDNNSVEMYIITNKEALDILNIVSRYLI